MYKTKQDVQNRVQENYDKLIKDGYEVIGVFLQGSQNYELDYDGSDVDCKAIILPSFDDFLFGRKQISTTLILENNEHIDLKDIRLMFDNFKKQNINFVEILFTEYKVMNPKYEQLFNIVFENNEKIAHYNNYKSLNCIMGMSKEKYKALEHPYPATKDKIEKFGFDPKQFHHLLRLNEFVKRYLNNELYKECLVSKEKEFLVKIKKDGIYSLKDARFIAKTTDEETYNIVKNYMSKNEILVNKDVEILLNKILSDIVRLRFKEELKYQ